MSTELFPSLAGLGWSVSRVPIFMTRVQESISGKRVRIADQSYPRWRWELTFNFLRQGAFNGTTYNEFSTLAGFFNSRQGRFDTFLYQDPDDNAVAGQPLGTGDGATISFQMIRTFGNFVEPVLAPNAISSVTVGGTPITPGSGYTVSHWGSLPPGVINFAVAPALGAAIVASFTYYWPCTFSEDELSFSKFMQSLWDGKKVGFESVK